MANTKLSKVKFSQTMQVPNVQKTISNYITDPKRASRFTSSIISAVSATPALEECDHVSIVSAALLGESLNLAPSPQLGQFYMVPFKDKKSEVKKAQFIVGYKGLLQLAIRSGQFKSITALEIKAGEFKSFNPLTDDLEIQIESDPVKRKLLETVGYFGRFELLNGFAKAMYMTKDEMEVYADEFSSAFKLSEKRKIDAGQIPEKDMWKYASFWYKDFDTMAKKTIIRRLLNSGFAPLSIELQSAIEKDDTSISTNDDGTFTADYEDAKEVFDAPKDVQESPPVMESAANGNDEIDMEVL